MSHCVLQVSVPETFSCMFKFYVFFRSQSPQAFFDIMWLRKNKNIKCRRITSGMFPFTKVPDEVLYWFLCWYWFWNLNFLNDPALIHCMYLSAVTWLTHFFPISKWLSEKKKNLSNYREDQALRVPPSLKPLLTVSVSLVLPVQADAPADITADYSCSNCSTGN